MLTLLLSAQYNLVTVGFMSKTHAPNHLAIFSRASGCNMKFTTVHLHDMGKALL